MVTTSLSDRRRDVLALYGAGLERTQIAERLGLPERTVKRDIREIVDRARSVVTRLAGASPGVLGRLAHKTADGFSSVKHAPSRKRVVLEVPLGESSPYGMATVVYGVGLLVAAKALGWPSADEVEAIFARYP